MTASPPGIQVEGLRELRDAARKAGNRKELDKGLRQAHKKVAKDVEAGSRAEAATGSRQQRAAVRAILGQGRPETSIIKLRNNMSVPFGIGAFMGALAWKQFPPWVGQTWDVTAADGPYILAATIARELESIKQTFVDEIGDALRSFGLDMETT